MELLLHIAKEVAGIDSLDELLTAIVEIIAKETGGDRGTLFLNDAQTGELYSRVAQGTRFREIRILNNQGIAGHVFTTGEGSPYGLAMVPVVKISSRTALAEKWPDLIDIDAGRIATGHATLDEVGWQIFHYLLAVASGQKPWAEHWGLANTLTPFNPGPVT